MSRMVEIDCEACKRLWRAYQETTIKLAAQKTAVLIPRDLGTRQPKAPLFSSLAVSSTPLDSAHAQLGARRKLPVRAPIRWSSGGRFWKLRRRARQGGSATRYSRTLRRNRPYLNILRLDVRHHVQQGPSTQLRAAGRYPTMEDTKFGATVGIDDLRRPDKGAGGLATKTRQYRSRGTRWALSAGNPLVVLQAPLVNVPNFGPPFEMLPAPSIAGNQKTLFKKQLRSVRYVSSAICATPTHWQTNKGAGYSTR
jgi:hypothetical protein